MSWAEEDWTVGLSGRVLQKVKELQVFKERLSRENKQKQLQLDNIHTSLEKQTAKYEAVRGELQFVQRDLQSVREEAKAAVTARERLAQELHTKQAQVCSLEGQLDAARNQNNHLSQEIKRLEAELEKLQNSSRRADTTLFSTPCWTASSPWEHNGSRQEDRPGQRDEGQSRGHHIRQRLQFSEASAASLPRQQHKSTPLRHPSDQSDVFSTPSAVFPWERDDSGPASRRRPASSPQAPSPEVLNQGRLDRSSEEKVQKTETDVSSSELQSRLSALEVQLSEKVGNLKTVQNEMGLMKKELAAKELDLQKTQEELSKAHTQTAQDKERASEAEHKLKQLQEELKCQRQNAESSRLQHQQRTKELEKVHQKDLAELQKERQCAEKQHQQEVNKLNQELQQARSLHNALQAQADKLTLQKQTLDKELDSLKEKLKWTEEQLKESQKKETQTQAKLTEAVREAEGVAVTLEQSRKRERALEEEGRRLQEEQADTLRLLRELQEQKAPAASTQPAPFGLVGQSFSSPSQAAAHSRRISASQSEQNRDVSRSEVTAVFPSAREPGEGIDAEQISITNSERQQKVGQREEADKDGESRRNAADIDRATAAEHPAVAGGLKIKHAQLPKSDEPAPSQDLKRENDSLRLELRDVREELQRRLEDLEAQRRAETEARTRLKQLSRKQSTQAAEREEREKDLKVKLENEKAETERLKRSLAALEAETKRSREEEAENEKKQEEETSTTQNDRESELIELNMQLKNQLAMVKAQLALERDERKTEEEERNRRMNTDSDVNTELSLKLAEIMADVEELKHRREEDSVEDEKLSTSSSPLPSLPDDELTSNTGCSDNSLLSSPEEHHFFCESTNQRNALLSTEAEDILRLGGQTTKETSDQIKLSSSDLQQDQRPTSDLAKVVEVLQKKCAKESERAKKYRDKFEALQIQVTRQTKELTTAFEKQSQHILGLLAELQEKEGALLSQGDELKQCKQELNQLKLEESNVATLTADRETEERNRDEELTEKSELKQEEEAVAPLLSSDLNIQKETIQPNVEECEVELPPPVGGEGESAAVTSGERSAVGPCDSVGEVEESRLSQHGERVDTLAELLVLRQEKQLLQQRVRDLTSIDTRDQTSQTDSENQDNAENMACLAGEVLLKDEAATDQQLLINPKSSDDEGQDLEGENTSSMSGERNAEDMTEIQINHLQEQVEALQRRVKTLTEETEVQAQELVLWRLASQSATAVQHLLTDADDESETLRQIPAASRPELTRTGHNQVQKNPDAVTVIREDEVSLCCSSRKLQGRLLFSRLQNSSLPEPKSLRSPKKSLQGQTRSGAEFDPESEKENQEINLHWSESYPEQNKVKKDAKLIQMSSQKIAQHHGAKDLSLSGSSLSKVQHFHTETHQTKLDSFRGAGDFETQIYPCDSNMKVEAVSVGSQTEGRLLPRGVSTASAATQTEQDFSDEEESVESPPVSPVSSAEKTEAGDKMLLSGSFPIPADPARLAERIRRSRTQLSAAFDDTEYEPYGLPEVVMKGFADIPTGTSCPYIVRRGLLGTVQPLSKKEPREDEETD
ncbi:centromere protein F [Poecilia reticulata]|uniref:centromere protein F n=1 Tax=Poecilia reticulata TaxID=8081 RepID=UPI0004A2E782|nr:PREDICTED: centromere protein F-like [Poecilia reticulata]XP_008418679.1 PREDICTED: centromere protein F-like [Poecilia reticulata]